MRDFAFSRAATVPEALAALGPDTMPIAGGTELLNWQRLGIAAPARLVDIGRIARLRGVARDGDMLTIGALTTLNEVGLHPLVKAHAAVLGEACLKAASAQVRNRATLGGNVLQKTRCAYFRAESPLAWGCNKRAPGSGCAALAGISDHHAILGGTAACVATQPSDPAVALACLDATVDIVGPGQARSLPMTAFHLTQAEAAAAGLDAARTENRLAPGELIIGYRVPIRAGERSRYLKVRERESYAYAVVAAAAAVRRDGDRIAAARVALGSVAQRPWRLVDAEAHLAGLPLTRAALLEPVRVALAAATPPAASRFKVTLAANAAVRAILMAGDAA